MKLEQFLTDHKEEIIERWFEKIIESYPAESGKFFLDKNRKFSNPVGYTIFEEISKLYDHLLSGTISEATEKSSINFICLFIFSGIF